jgi:hypothetical protein
MANSLRQSDGAQPLPSQVAYDEPLEGYDRFFVNDPFANRIELMLVKAFQPASLVHHSIAGSMYARSDVPNQAEADEKKKH